MKSAEFPFLKPFFLWLTWGARTLSRAGTGSEPPSASAAQQPGRRLRSCCSRRRRGKCLEKYHLQIIISRKVVLFFPLLPGSVHPAFKLRSTTTRFFFFSRGSKTTSCSCCSFCCSGFTNSFSGLSVSWSFLIAAVLRGPRMKSQMEVWGKVLKKHCFSLVCDPLNCDNKGQEFFFKSVSIARCCERSSKEIRVLSCFFFFYFRNSSFRKVVLNTLSICMPTSCFHDLSGSELELSFSTDHNFTARSKFSACRQSVRLKKCPRALGIKFTPKIYQTPQKFPIISQKRS